MTELDTCDNSPDVSILIVCYKSLGDIDRCLASLYKYTSTDINFEVLLVDNFDDGTLPLVREKYPQVIIVDNDKNLGFAGGNNLLADHATGKNILLLNPDTELTFDAVSALCEVAKAHPDHGAWGGATYFPDGEREYSSLQFAPTIKNELLKFCGLAGTINEARPISKTEGLVHVLSGAFMMVETSVWKKVKGFDLSYFLYSEEVDLCLRIAALTGRRVLMTTAASVIHYVGKSSSNSDRTVLIYKGKMHLDRKMYGSAHNLVMMSVLWLYALSRYSIGLVLHVLGKKEKSLFMRESFVSALKHPSKWYEGYK